MALSNRKQKERASRISSLPQHYHDAISSDDRRVLNTSIEDLSRDVRKCIIRPTDILRSYGKVALLAHRATNCLTEILLPAAEEWAESRTNLNGPLAGIPISLKDSINVGGFDSCIGYSCKTGQPHSQDGVMVQLLRDAGAIPYLKTNIPITLLSFESTNDVWGRCKNPHNQAYSPGGSTGGEAALLAFGGGRIGIGSDVAGSVRVPAHFSGIYALRCSTGRWPKSGGSTSMPGQEGIPAVYSPMARTLGDLTYFTRSIVSMMPWKYDYTVHPIEWRASAEKAILDAKSLRIGVMLEDGVVDPSPACARALSLASAALSAAGHVVINVNPPSPYTALRIASQLLLADGGRTFLSYFRAGESQDRGVAQMTFLSALPSPFRYLYYLYTKYVRQDVIWAELIRDWREKSIAEQWRLVAERETYKASWHEWWQQEKLDVLLCVPNATPAVPHDGMGESVSSCGYTFMFNLLDYTSGVLPVTHVDRALDQLPEGFDRAKLNGVARGAYANYDADRMHGLPVGVQVVGQRLQEEKVLAAMKRVEDALREHGIVYEQLAISS